MIQILTPSEVKAMRQGGKILQVIHRHLRARLVVGMTGKKLDHLAGRLIRRHHCQPNFLGYYGYQHSICVSINNVLVHGVPTDQKFQPGDVVSVDTGLIYQGIHLDSAFTVIIASPRCPADQQLVTACQRALQAAVEVVRPGVAIGTIGHTIETCVNQFGFYVTRNYCGHGIGKAMHQAPEIYNYGRPGNGVKLKTNMAICIEPIVQAQAGPTKVLADH